MSINFPSSLDTFINPTATSKRNSPSLAGQQSDQNDSIEALEAKVGIDGSAVTTSHDYKLSGITGSDKAASVSGSESLNNKILVNPVIKDANGFNVLTFNTGSDNTNQDYLRINNSNGASPFIEAIGTSTDIDFHLYPKGTGKLYYGNIEIVNLSGSQVLTNKTLTSPVINTGISGTAIDTDGTLTANSDTILASQKAVKTYADTKLATASKASSSDVTTGTDDAKYVTSAALAGLDTKTSTYSNKTLTSPVLQGTVDGWISANESWSYASATTITVPSGAAAKYRKGDKIKLTQTTVKYFYVINVADTILTITGGSSYTLVNAAISANYYSHDSSPAGFPVSMALTAPIFTASGTAFTNQPTATVYVLTINGDLATVIIEPKTAASGTGTGIWTLTFTAGQIPPTVLSSGGMAGSTGTCPTGTCMIQASASDVIKMVKFDGSTSITGDNSFFYASLTYRI